MPLFSPRRRKESLFDRKSRDGFSGRTLFRIAIVLAIILTVFLVAKDQVAFYAALYEGRRAITRGDFSEAERALERAWTKKPGHPYVLDSAGLLFLNQQETGWKAKAQDYYAQAVEQGLRSNPFINHTKEARKHLDSGQYDSAEVELSHALELSPKSAVCNLLAGHLYYAKGKLQKALSKYEEALALSPGSAEIENAMTRA